MKRTSLLVLLLLVVGIIYSQNPEQKVKEDFKKLDWLEGDWTRLNVKPGRTAYESWQKISDIEWRGSGINLKGTDTAFIEKLKIIIKGDSIYYVADITENMKPVYFRLTMLSTTGFTCENTQHDFPKKISYQKEGNRIKATISGDGKSIDYLFEKK